jgi:hypothetical protein
MVKLGFFILILCGVAKTAEKPVVVPAYIRSLIIKEAKDQGVKPEWALALVRTESKFKIAAKRPEVNSSGKFIGYSLGLFQVLQPTAKKFCKLKTIEAILNVKNNIKCGLKYLKYQLDRYNNNIDDAILAYNAGAVKVCGLRHLIKGIKCDLGSHVNEYHLIKFKAYLSETIDQEIKEEQKKFELDFKNLIDTKEKKYQDFDFYNLYV